MKYGMCMCCGKVVETISENEKGLCAECTEFQESTNKKMLEDYIRNESLYKAIEAEWTEKN